VLLQNAVGKGKSAITLFIPVLGN